MKTPAVPWDGVEKTAIANPEALKHALADLRAAQKAIGRSVKVNGRARTRNRHRLCGKPARQHARVARIRSDHHQATAQMAKRGGVTVETLNVDGMKRNRRLAGAICDAGMAGFVRQLEYKCGRHGTAFRRVDRRYPSSGTCSRCEAEKQSLLLPERTFRCNRCGFECDRDANAARNLQACTGHTEPARNLNARPGPARSAGDPGPGRPVGRASVRTVGEVAIRPATAHRR